MIGSASDPGEQFDAADLPVEPRAIVRTEGAAGGSYRTQSGAEGRYRPAPLPGPVADTYGAGDVMMAALTLELGAGRALEEALASSGDRGSRAADASRSHAASRGVKFRIDTSATAIAATTMTRSPAAMPSASQIGDTSMPARQRSRDAQRDVEAARS